MTVIEGTRKVMQEFLVPELRAVAVGLGAFKKESDAADRKVDEVDPPAVKRHEETISAIRQVFDLNSIQQRLTLLESEMRTHQ